MKMLIETSHLNCGSRNSEFRAHVLIKSGQPRYIIYIIGQTNFSVCSLFVCSGNMRVGTVHDYTLVSHQDQSFASLLSLQAYSVHPLISIKTAQRFVLSSLQSNEVHPIDGASERLKRLRLCLFISANALTAKRAKVFLYPALFFPLRRRSKRNVSTQQSTYYSAAFMLESSAVIVQDGTPSYRTSSTAILFSCKCYLALQAKVLLLMFQHFSRPSSGLLVLR